MDHFSSTKSISLAPTPMSHWKNLPPGETLHCLPWSRLQSPTEPASGPSLRAEPTRVTSSHLLAELTHADWPRQPPRCCWVHFGGVEPPPLVQASATNTASARLTASAGAAVTSLELLTARVNTLGSWPRSHRALSGWPVWERGAFVFVCSSLQMRDRLSDRTS